MPRHEVSLRRRYSGGRQISLPQLAYHTMPLYDVRKLKLVTLNKVPRKQLAAQFLSTEQVTQLSENFTV